jgi:hypothetical protein
VREQHIRKTNQNDVADASGERYDKVLAARAINDAAEAQASIPIRHDGIFWKKART